MTLEIPDGQKNWFRRPSDNVRNSQFSKISFTENFSKLINVQIRHFKKFHCPLSKISLHYQTIID